MAFFRAKHLKNTPRTAASNDLEITPKTNQQKLKIPTSPFKFSCVGKPTIAAAMLKTRDGALKRCILGKFIKVVLSFLCYHWLVYGYSDRFQPIRILVPFVSLATTSEFPGINGAERSVVTSPLSCSFGMASLP